MASPSLEQASQTAHLKGNGGRMVLIQIKGGKKTHRSELWILYLGLSKSLLYYVTMRDTCVSVATGVVRASFSSMCPESSPRPPRLPLI